jgi:hypothetical protein
MQLKEAGAIHSQRQYIDSSVRDWSFLYAASFGAWLCTNVCCES